MYSRSPAFAQAHQAGGCPLVILGLRTPGGRRLHARHTPSLAQTGFKSTVRADAAWPADGSATAGVDAEPILARRRDVLKLGAVTESLTARSGEPLGLLAGARTSEMQVTLGQTGSPQAQGYFATLAVVEGLVGGWVEVEATYPGLAAPDALRRFSGRVRRAELTRDQVTLRLRAA